MHISINSDNVNTRLRRNQQKFKSPIILPHIKQDPEEYVSLLRKAEQRVLECLLFYSQRYSHINISQSKIAKWCKITREYVNRILTKLERDGILSMMYRHKKTSLYMVSSFFDVHIRAKISHIFRTFKVFSLSLLFSKPASDQYIDFYKDYSEISSQNIIRKESFIKTLPEERQFTYARTREKGREGFKKRIEKEMKLPSDRKKILQELSQGIVPDNFVSATIKNISFVKLTKSGQVKLMAFPDTVIVQAEQEARKYKEVKDPFGFLFSKCMSIAKDRGITPDYEWINQLKQTLKIEESSPSIISDPSLPSPSRGKGNNQEKETNWQLAKQRNDEWTTKSTTQDIPRIKAASQEYYQDANVSSVNMFRSILGLTDQGEFVNGATPERAIAILSGVNPTTITPKPVFDKETLEMVAWIKGNWDEKFFPHSNKWVHENIARVMNEGPSSPQYIDGSFMNGMKHIKRLMETILSRSMPIAQSQTQSAQIAPKEVPDQYIESDIQGGYDEDVDPFGDRL